jgi:hypothetical protein
MRVKLGPEAGVIAWKERILSAILVTILLKIKTQGKAFD